MEKSLVLYNFSGDVVRVFPWTQPEKVWTIYRKDNKRLEVLSSLEHLKSQKIPFEIINESRGQAIEAGPVKLNQLGYLQLAQPQSIAPTLSKSSETDPSKIKKIILASAFIYLSVGILLNTVLAPSEIAEVEVTPEKKREIVKVVQRKIERATTQIRQSISVAQTPTQPVKTAQPAAWKRSGALAALGQLNKGTQKGGLDLGAVKASAGIGLGGSQGSGGVQTSLYGKGMVAAPLGEGQNIKGGGGYGTEGKGGGKAGYGTLSLVGATGASLIPVPEEATVDGGLDSSLIADVVRRNLGQITFCYEQGLQMNNSLAGRVAVQWVIDGSGGVQSAKVKSTSLNDQNVEDCILRRLRTWKFPIPAGNQAVPVSYPFLLKRTGHG